MKKILISFALLFFTLNIGAQTINETVYLKNGSVIKGTIIEQVPNESLKIKTGDGSIFVFQMSEVTKITKEEVEEKPAKKVVVSDGKHRGLDFGINAGYLIGVGDAKDSNFPSLEMSLGKQLNKNLYLGLGAGAWIPTGDGDLQIPISVDSKIMFPSRSSNVTPLGIVRLGYVINTADDVKIDGYGYMDDQTIEAENAFMLQIMPGIELPLSKKTDFLLAAGYTHAFTDGGGGGYFSIKAGLNFHKNQSLKPRPKRPKAPVREKGFQLTLEGAPALCYGGEFAWFGNIAVTYKVNPHLSAGIGLGYESLSGIQGEGEIQLVGNAANERRYDMHSGSAECAKGFIRGTYRMSERSFSPIVSMDAGIRLYQDNSGFLKNLSYQSEEEAIGDIADNALFVAPSIGFSLRTTNNSYLELKAGYELVQRKSKKGQKEGTYYYVPSVNADVIFVSLGFTHTFGKRPARPPRPE